MGAEAAAAAAAAAAAMVVVVGGARDGSRRPRARGRGGREEAPLGLVERGAAGRRPGGPIQ